MNGRRLLIARALAAGAFVLATALPALAATPVHKCEVNGTVTFQSTPCPTGEQRPLPSVERLNAEARRRREAQASASASAPQPAAPVTAPHTAPPPIVNSPKQYRCDGRKYCSQMTSCAEAKYFLAHCPDVKMDGNHDGTPCEQQWCGH